MIIYSKVVLDGKIYWLKYTDVDAFNDLPRKKCRQVYGVCFYNNKMVIGFNGKKRTWGLVGGTIEPGETFEQTLTREIQEESNMKVLKSAPIGYQEVTDLENNKTIYQLRYCCIVKPYGPFISDPDDSITKIKLISPLYYKKYFDWGKIGERIIKRAIKLKEKLF